MSPAWYPGAVAGRLWGLGRGRCQPGLPLQGRWLVQVRGEQAPRPGARSQDAVTALRAKARPRPHAPARAVPAAATRPATRPATERPLQTQRRQRTCNKAAPPPPRAQGHHPPVRRR